MRLSLKVCYLALAYSIILFPLRYFRWFLLWIFLWMVWGGVRCHPLLWCSYILCMFCAYRTVTVIFTVQLFFFSRQGGMETGLEKERERKRMKKREREFFLTSLHPEISAMARVVSAKAGSQELKWVSRTQSPNPTPLPPRLCFNRRLDWKAGVGNWSHVFQYRIWASVRDCLWIPAYFTYMGSHKDTVHCVLQGVPWLQS